MLFKYLQELAKEMMGLKVTTGIDGMQPDTKEQFDDLEKAIGDKLGSLAALENYPDFAEKLVKRICLDCKLCCFIREIFLMQLIKRTFLMYHLYSEKA